MSEVVPASKLCARAWFCGFVLCCLLACWLTLQAAAASPTVSGLPDRPSSGRLALDRGWAALSDPAETLNVQTILEPAAQARFKAFDGPPSLGYFSGAAWLRLTLRPPAGVSGERLLELQFPPIDEATLFWPSPDGLLPGRTAGDRHPLAQRDFPHRNIIFRVTVEEGVAQTFYLRLRGANTFNFSVVLWEPSAFASAALTEQMLWGFVLAVHVVLILSNLWFFQATRDAPHGLFGLFALTSFLSVLFLEGFGYRYLFDVAPAVNDAMVVGSWMLAQPMAYLFVLRFIGLTGPGGQTWARALVGALFAFSGAMILADQMFSTVWARPVFSAVQLLSVATLALLLLGRSWQGVAEARQTFLAMLPLLLAVALRLARNLGLVEPDPLFDHGYYVGLVLYLLILNFAISRRQEAIRRAAQAAQTEALEVVRHSARALELRVEQRTAEIAAAMRQVQGSLALERRLRAEQREFFATVSHELRTPLAVIDATVQNLTLKQPQPDGPTQARLQKVLAATERMAALLDRQLRDDRLGGDGSSPALHPCDLTALLEEAAASARLLSDTHPVVVQTEGVSEPFMCDPTLTRLALGNLADNAVKYTPPGTRVLLTARPEGRRADDGVLIQVADEGPGVDPADRTRLFQGQFRGSATAATVPGTGTGLLLTRRMVEVQGGRLELLFPPEGGMVATIRLPAQGVPLGSPTADNASMGSPKA